MPLASSSLSFPKGDLPNFAWYYRCQLDIDSTTLWPYRYRDNCVQFTVGLLLIAQAGVFVLTLVFKGQTYYLFLTTKTSLPETIFLRCQMEMQNQEPQNIEQAIEDYEKCNYQLNTLFDFSKDVFRYIRFSGDSQE